MGFVQLQSSPYLSYLAQTNSQSRFRPSHFSAGSCSLSLWVTNLQFLYNFPLGHTVLVVILSSGIPSTWYFRRFFFTFVAYSQIEPHVNIQHSIGSFTDCSKCSIKTHPIWSYPITTPLCIDLSLIVLFSYKHVQHKKKIIWPYPQSHIPHSDLHYGSICNQFNEEHTKNHKFNIETTASHTLWLTLFLLTTTPNINTNKSILWSANFPSFCDYFFLTN